MIRAAAALVLVLGGTARAADPATTAYGGFDWMRLPTSIRQQSGGLYGTYDVFKAFGNPALAGYQSNTWEVGATNQVSFGGQQDIYAIAGGFSSQQTESGAFSVAAEVSGFSISDMHRFDEFDTDGGVVSPSGQQFGVVAAYQWKFFNIGAGFHQAHVDLLDATASQPLIDGGLAMSWRYLEMGFTIRDLETGVVGAPAVVAFGAAGKFGPVTLGFEGAMITGGSSFTGNPNRGYSTIGLTVVPHRLVELRTAVFIPPGQSLPGGYGLALRPGLTVKYRNIAVDYAASFNLKTGPGVEQRMGLGWSFGAERKPLTESVEHFSDITKIFSFGAAKGQSMAVANFEAQSVSASDAAVITDLFRNELVKDGSFDVIEKGNMDKILSEQSFQQTGCTTQECAVKLGKILNAKYLVVGTFGKLMDQYILSFRVVEIETARALYSDDARGLSTQKDVSDALKELVKRPTAAVKAGGTK